MFRLLCVVIAVAMMPVKSDASDVMLFMSVDSSVTGLENIQTRHNVKILFTDSFRLILDPINQAGKTVGSNRVKQDTFITEQFQTLDKEALSKAVGDSLKVNALAKKLGIKTYPAVAVRTPEGLRIVRFKGRVDQAVQRALQ